MNNCVTLIGRVVKVYDNSINIAVSRDYRNEYGIYETDFIKVKTSANINTQAKNYLRNGDLIGIKGRLETENHKIVLIAEKLSFLSCKTREIENV